MEVRDLCLVRHAKSSWDEPGQDDFDRTLDARGRRDAPMMAMKMKEMGLVPDYIITSGAKRARKTAMYFKELFNLPDRYFEINNDIYEASAETIYKVIRSAPDQARFLYLFGHNPTLTWIANHISGVHIDNVPTCGVFHVQASLTSWANFKPEYAAFIGFHYPKQF